MAKTALVTGANKGIGREVARQLLAKGWRVVVAARRGDAGERTAGELGEGARALLLDVADEASIAAAAEVFGSAGDRLDALVNNAAIYPDEGVDIVTIGRRQLNETFATNVFGALRVTQAFLPHLQSSDGSRVVNVSSGYGQLSGLSAGVPSYCLSKLTLNGITLMLHQALHERGISVNSVCPGWVRTDMGGPSAERSVEQGADTIVWLVADANPSPSGKFFRDRREIPW